MEPKGSSPYTQEPATYPYPKPDQSSPTNNMYINKQLKLSVDQLIFH